MRAPVCILSVRATLKDEQWYRMCQTPEVYHDGFNLAHAGFVFAVDEKEYCAFAVLSVQDERLWLRQEEFLKAGYICRRCVEQHDKRHGDGGESDAHPPQGENGRTQWFVRDMHAIRRCCGKTTAWKKTEAQCQEGFL